MCVHVCMCSSLVPGSPEFSPQRDVPDGRGVRERADFP